jgi:hypothetical protein
MGLGIEVAHRVEAVGTGCAIGVEALHRMIETLGLLADGQQIDAGARVDHEGDASAVAASRAVRIRLTASGSS